MSPASILEEKEEWRSLYAYDTKDRKKLLQFYTLKENEKEVCVAPVDVQTLEETCFMTRFVNFVGNVLTYVGNA